jgi:hypothetical protein
MDATARNAAANSADGETSPGFSAWAEGRRLVDTQVIAAMMIILLKTVFIDLSSFVGKTLLLLPAGYPPANIAFRNTCENRNSAANDEKPYDERYGPTLEGEIPNRTFFIE